MMLGHQRSGLSHLALGTCPAMLVKVSSKAWLVTDSPHYADPVRPGQCACRYTIPGQAEAGAIAEQRPVAAILAWQLGTGLVR